MTELQRDFVEWFYSGDWIEELDCYRGVNTEEGKIIDKENAYGYAVSRLMDEKKEEL